MLIFIVRKKPPPYKNKKRNDRYRNNKDKHPNHPSFRIVNDQNSPAIIQQFVAQPLTHFDDGKECFNFSLFSLFLWIHHEEHRAFPWRTLHRNSLMSDVQPLVNYGKRRCAWLFAGLEEPSFLRSNPGTRLR